MSVLPVQRAHAAQDEETRFPNGIMETLSYRKGARSAAPCPFPDFQNPLLQIHFSKSSGESSWLTSASIYRISLQAKLNNPGVPLGQTRAAEPCFQNAFQRTGAFSLLLDSAAKHKRSYIHTILTAQILTFQIYLQAKEKLQISVFYRNHLLSRLFVSVPC